MVHFLFHSFAAGEKAFAAGWGKTNFFARRYPEFLQFLAVQIIPFSQCSNGNRRRLSAHHLCAGTMVMNKSTTVVSNHINLFLTSMNF
jgi:hypothetical protein